MAGSLQDRLTRLAGQGAEALTGAVAAWASGVRQLVEALPDPATVVNGTFDVAEEVLRAQREAALTVVRLAFGGRDPAA
jgi:hypothetical protein